MTGPPPSGMAPDVAPGSFRMTLIEFCNEDNIQYMPGREAMAFLCTVLLPVHQVLVDPALVTDIQQTPYCVGTRTTNQMRR